MTPQELYKAGELGQAIKALGEELRGNPLDAKRRSFLFELLCFAGEYDRAEKQLDVLADQNPKHAAGTLLYRSALYAERIRQEMFRTGNLPSQDNAADEGSDVGGEWNGKRFASLLDADARFGESLEVFIAGDYTWVPIKYIVGLEIEPPTSLRDLLWVRARIECGPAFRLQELGEVLLAGDLAAVVSFNRRRGAAGADKRLGRDAGRVPSGLLGQKMLLVDGEEIPLLEFSQHRVGYGRR